MPDSAAQEASSIQAPIRSPNKNWLAFQLIRDVEELRAMSGLPNDAQTFAAMLENNLSTWTFGSPINVAHCRDLVIIDFPEKLAARDRIEAITSRGLPLASCSLYVIVDESDKADALVELNNFKQRLDPHVVVFASKFVEDAPPNPDTLCQCSNATYLREITLLRLDEAMRAAAEQLATLPASCSLSSEAIQAEIDNERQWLKRRLTQLSDDLTVAYSSSEPLTHMNVLMQAVSSDLERRFAVHGLDFDAAPFVVSKAQRGAGLRAVGILRDIILTIKTNGFWLLSKLGQPLATEPGPHEVALQRLLKRDIDAAIHRTYTAIEPRIEAIVAHKKAQTNPHYADILRWTTFVGRAIALRRRLLAG